MMFVTGVQTLLFRSPYSVYIFLFPDCAISFIISTFISAWQSLTHPSKPCLNISSSRKVPALSRRVIIYAVPPAVCDRTYQNVVKSTGLLTCHSLSFHWEFLKVKVYISRRLEALVPSRDSRARTRSPSPRAWRPDFPVHRPQRPAGSTHSSTRGLRPPEPPAPEPSAKRPGS